MPRKPPITEARYLPFVDWLKTIGIALIVYGHVAAATTVTWTPPVYPKQLGVAFFVFATGFTLARETRDRFRVVYNRYFEVYFFGLVFACMMAVIGSVFWSDPNESNFLPLLAGLNVLVNDFPANPTTWYIGTYLHLLLLWAVVLRKVRIRWWMLAAACALEIALRSVLIETQGRFIAYMMASNWLTVFMLGLAWGRNEARGSDIRSRVGAVLLFVGWPLLASLARWDLTFPFMTIQGLSSAAAGAVLVSLAASFVYIGFTVAAYRLTVDAPAPALVRFIARNTSIIFIAHMPFYYLLEYVLGPIVTSYGLRVGVEFLLCLGGLAIVSEGVRRVAPPVVLRERIAHRTAVLFGSATVASSRV